MSSSIDNEMIDFVNFPETNLQAYFGTRAILMESEVSPTLFFPRNDLMSPIQFVSEPIKLATVPEESLATPYFTVDFDKQALTITSPCPPKPARFPLSSSSAHVQSFVRESNFEVLREKISTSLSSMPKYDFSYDESCFMWRGKTIVGARFLEVAVRCFWDKKQQDHLLTIHKLAGDLCRQQQCGPSAILQYLKVSLQLCKANEQFPAKPSLMRSLPHSTPSFTPNSQQDSSESNYFTCLKTIQDMLQSPFLDMHLEAARMFYETVDFHQDTVVGVPCERLACEIMRSLLSLPTVTDSGDLRDTSDGETLLVKQQCGVLAFQLLLSHRLKQVKENCPVLSWAREEGCSLLWQLICDNTYTDAFLYANIATRREAAMLVSQILSTQCVTTSSNNCVSLVQDMSRLWQTQGATHIAQDTCLSRLCAEHIVPWFSSTMQ